MDRATSASGLVGPRWPLQDGRFPHRREHQTSARTQVDEQALNAWLTLLRAFGCVALALAIAAAAVQLSWLVFDLQHKSYGEGPILAMIERMRSEPISASWMHEPPYTLSCYGPAYYWLTYSVAHIGGWNDSLVPGRLIAVVATLAIALMTAVAATRHTKNIAIGLLAALMFLVSLPVTEWVPYARVDLLAVAFAATAYLSVGDNLRSLVVAAVLVMAGSLAKPTVALSAVPIAAHLLATRRRRDAAVFSAIVAALGGAAWGIAEWTSNGFFLTAVLAGNRNPMQFWRGYFFTYEFLQCPLGAVATIVAIGTLIVSPQRFAKSLYSLGFVVSLVISAVTVCKRGSELNYFIEPALLGSLAIAIDGVPILFQAGARRSLVAAVMLALVLGLPNVREIKGHLRSPMTEPAAYATVRSLLIDEPDDVGILADGRQVDMVLAAGHRPWINDSYLYMLLVENGTLDTEPLIERLRDGRIKWLVFRRSLADHHEAIDRDSYCWPLDAMDVMTEEYELAKTENGVWVYRHRRG
jgi:hypothetical protein